MKQVSSTLSTLSTKWSAMDPATKERLIGTTVTLLAIAAIAILIWAAAKYSPYCALGILGVNLAAAIYGQLRHKVNLFNTAGAPHAVFGIIIFFGFAIPVGFSFRETSNPEKPPQEQTPLQNR